VDIYLEAKNCDLFRVCVAVLKIKIPRNILMSCHMAVCRSNSHFKGFSLYQGDNILVINSATNLPSQVEDNIREAGFRTSLQLIICNVPEQPILSVTCSSTITLRAVIYS
jgi:hypothetical protein